MVKVCDAIMGAGKTSAVINYVNAHPEKRFIYITPFNDETERIAKSCPNARFVLPKNNLKEFGFRKYSHFRNLIRDGKNISITHKLFSMCDSETIAEIKGQNYTIIIDEVMEVVEKISIGKSDVKLILDSGWLKEVNGEDGFGYEFDPVAAGGDYESGKYADLFLLAKNHRLIKLATAKTSGVVSYWSLPKEMFECAEEVYLLTYLFEGSVMKGFLEGCGISYKYIGVKKDEYSGYTFTSTPQPYPEYVQSIREKIHIFDNYKLNEIGKKRTALSSAWYERATMNAEFGDFVQLKNNVYNYFMNYMRDRPADERLWSTYKKGETHLRKKGYFNSSIPFNSRATNNYSDKRVLAYCVNVFLDPNVVRYIEQFGGNVDCDVYALSVMIQWIWRSAIRNGEEIWIYIPSGRMRTLLKNWMEEVSKNVENS